MLQELLTTENLIGLFTLSLLEIVLGIDNIIFVSIISGRLPQAERAKGRSYGLVLALVVRIILLFAIKWVIGLDKPLFQFINHHFTGRDLILLAGGLFLLYKSTVEIHHKLEGAEETKVDAAKKLSFASALSQIVVINLVFSIDSIVTAIGLTKNIAVMGIAIVISMVVMILVAGKISDFIEKHPSLKMLALSFLMMIGVLLVAEGSGKEIEKGYVYFAMAFALIVEVLNINLDKKSNRPVRLHEHYRDNKPDEKQA
jgi:predicted tellurium resistance membrane protein TerC